MQEIEWSTKKLFLTNFTSTNKYLIYLSLIKHNTVYTHCPWADRSSEGNSWGSFCMNNRIYDYSGIYEILFALGSYCFSFFWHKVGTVVVDSEKVKYIMQNSTQ